MIDWRWVRWARWPSIALAGLLAIGLGVLHLPQTQQYALRRAISLLREQGVEFDASRIGFNLFELSATLDKVVVRSPAAPDLPPILEVDQAHVTFSLRKLIQGAYHLEDGVVRNPRINLVVDETGRDNIPRLAQNRKPNSQVDYLIDRLLISGGMLRYEDRRQQITTELPLRELTIDGNSLTRNHEIRLLAGPGGRLQFHNRSLPITNVAGAAVVSENSVNVRRLEIAAGANSIQLSGALTSFEDPDFDLKVETKLALGSLFEFGGVPQKGSGNVNVSLTADGPVGRLKVRARVEGHDLSVDRFDQLSLQAEATYDAAASRVRLESLNVVSSSGTVRGEGSLALTPEAGRSTANVSASDVNLAQISRALRLPVLIGSRAAVNIAANWPALEFEKAAGSATVRLAATRSRPAAGVLPVSGALRARSQGETVVFDFTDLSVLATRASGRVSLTNREALSGTIRLELPDLNSTVAGAYAYLGEQPAALPNDAIRGGATLTATLGGTTGAPRVNATLAAEGLQSGRLQGIDLTAKVNYTPARVAVEDLSLQWREQRLTASGAIGLAGRDPQLDIRAATSGIEIETVLAGLNRTDIQASGKVELQAKITGTRRRPQADVYVMAEDLAAYNESLGTLQAEMQIRDQVARVIELALHKPQPQGEGILRMSGSYGLESRAYTLQVESKNLRLNSLTIPQATPVKAELQLRAQGKGSLENPEFKLQLRADNVEIRERQLGSVDLTAEAANQKAAINLKAPKYGVTATANIGALEPYPVEFAIDARNADITNFPLEVDPQLSGQVTASIRGTGELQRAKLGEVSADVPSLELNWRGQPIRAEHPLRFRYSDQVLSIDQATIAAGESRISVKGELPLDPAGTGAIEIAAKLDLPTLARYVPSGKPIIGHGQATVNGTIRGNLERIDPSIALSLAGGSFLAPGQKYPVSEIDLAARIEGGALELQRASARFGPASFTATGTVPFGLLPANLPVELPRRQGAAQFSAELKSLDLASLPDKPEKLAGTVSARLDIHAPRPDWQAVSGTLSFPELRVNVGSYGLQQAGTSQVVFENGTARIASFVLSGPETEIRLAGTAGLASEGVLDLRLDGQVDASIASAFTDAVRVSGPTEIEAAITGTAKQPQASGSVQMAEGQLSIEQPRIGAERLNLRLELEGKRLKLAKLEGSLNGGTLSGGGGVDLDDGEFRNADLNVKAEGVYLDFPQGLKTVSNITLALQTAANEIVLGGNVSILEGGFSDDLDFDRGILAALSAPSRLDLTEERNKTLEKVRLSVGVRTEEPLVVDNNLAEAEVSVDARVVGTPYEPGLSGRLQIAEEGELRFQERRYVVERGLITFTNERRIEPNLDIIANTTAGGYDIRLQVESEGGRTKTTLTSDPALPEPDIMALLITGKTMDEMRGQEFEVASNQVLSYLTGRVGSQLGRGVENITGLSTVRIEPNLIAAETDPGARLTVGQDITRNLELIYSMDLVNSSDQIYVAEYDISKRFTTRGVRQSDGSFRIDFKHDLRFGGLPEPRRGLTRARPEVGQISFTGNTFFSEKRLADKLKVDSSDRYDFFKVRKGMDRIYKLYKREDMLEARVRLKRETHGGAVDLNLDILPGPKVEFQFEGLSLPRKLQNRVREVWHRGAFDLQRAEDSKAAIREWLVRKRYLQPSLSHSVLKPVENTKQVVFNIEEGPRFKDVKIEFEGADRIEGGALRDIVRDQKMSNDVYTRPGWVAELLTRYYHEQGYLEAEVSPPRYDLNPQAQTGRVVFPVSEGPLYRINKVEFEGNTVFSDAHLAEAVPLPRNEGYRPALRENALRRLKDLYWDKGYNDVDAEFALTRNGNDGTVDITFRIAEHRKSVVREIVVEGNDKTSDNMILTQLEVRTGEPVSVQKLSNSRRNLYRTGSYSLVDILREPAGSSNGTDAVTPVRLRVKVQEVQPFQFRYGGFFDTERGPGIIVDVSNRNSLGSARELGLRARYDSQLRESRIYFSQPTLRRFPLKTIASIYGRQERNPETEDADPFNVDRLGLSVQQEAALRKSYLFNYGYRIEQTRTYDPSPNRAYDNRVRVASLTSTLTRETRDELMDATRGSFTSHAFQLSPSVLGSQSRFIKYFGQYFKYFSLQKPRIELFTNEVLRPRLVYATGVRVGLAKGFGGQDVPLSERFFAGGGTTIRGFEQNSVGPVAPNREPLGGAAMLVINNEIRFPLASIFDGVGFVDVGNVYPTVSDMRLSDLRKSGGVGLRVRTPWFLLRLDYGLKLDRREGESRGRLFISIGQAF